MYDNVSIHIDSIIEYWFGENSISLVDWPHTYLI